jgi:hypothetical protein
MRGNFSSAIISWLRSISFCRRRPINRCGSRFSVFREKPDVLWKTVWTGALAASGVPGQLASDMVALILSLVRRTLWDNDPEWFDELFALWRAGARMQATESKTWPAKYTDADMADDIG